MSDPSNWVAAGAAVIAAGVVAWQAWETRKAAQASERAVDAADRAVLAANEGLEISRQQAAEAVRARIDAACARITVTLGDEPAWPPLEPSIYQGDEPQPHRYGTSAEPWHMPRDRAKQVLVRAPVVIQNHSDVTVSLRVYELFDEKGQTLGETLDLGPEERREAWVAVTRTLEEWIAIHRQRESGAGGDEATGTVYHVDPADTGADDRWDLTIAGCPVEPVPDLEGGWRVLERPARNSGRPGAMGLGPVFRQRTYYLSKIRGERLT